MTTRPILPFMMLFGLHTANADLMAVTSGDAPAPTAITVGDADRGMFTDDTTKCSSYTDTWSPNQINVMEEGSGDHNKRMDHCLWHGVRNAWGSFSKEERKLLNQFGYNVTSTEQPGVPGFAPLCPSPMKDHSNPAGEEFLFMHHNMIEGLDTSLTEAGQPCIRGWSKIPGPNDTDFPVPKKQAGDPITSDLLNMAKSDSAFAGMQALESAFTDPKTLKGRTLSEIGYAVEFTLHNQMHQRWSDFKGNAAPGANSGDAFANYLSDPNGVPTPLDPKKNNWLGDPFSAHVNPNFWKLHGWIDNLVLMWLKANDYSEIKKDCTNGGERTAPATCYQWKSQYEGPGQHNHGGPAASSNHQAATKGLTEGAKTDPKVRALLEKVRKASLFEVPKELSTPRSAGTSPTAGAVVDPFATAGGRCKSDKVVVPPPFLKRGG